MRRSVTQCGRWSTKRFRTCSIVDTNGAQIVEFAVTLPLLVAIFVGIYDFTNAFNLKQKLTGAVREGARFSSNQSTSDLTRTTPISVLATRDVVDTYLSLNNVNDCGLGSATPSPAGNLIWQFTATANNCPSPGLTLTIQRGLVIPYTPGGGNTVHVESTQVTLTYTYQWQFGHVATFLVPGAQYGSSQIPASSVMQNLN